MLLNQVVDKTIVAAATVAEEENEVKNVKVFLLSCIQVAKFDFLKEPFIIGKLHYPFWCLFLLLNSLLLSCILSLIQVGSLM
jgi:hypothetical protein